MATIANLNVKLTAGIGGFAADMGKAAKTVASFGGEVASSLGQVSAWGGAISALATGGGLGILIKSQLEAIDSSAKLSDRLGIQTEKLAGLQHAAAISNVSSDALTGGLEKMLKALGGAADDGENAANAFTLLGLDAAKLANMQTDQAFAAIADKIKEIHNPAERAAIAVQIFGKAGQSLLPLLMSGAEGIAAAQAEAEKLGITFNRIDAAKVEAANDSMTRAGEVIKGVGNTLSIELAPFIEAAANKFVALATAGDGMGKKVANGFEYVVKGAAKTMDFVELLEGGWESLRGVAGAALLGVLVPLDLWIQGIDYLYNKLTGSHTAFAGFAHDVTKAVGEDTAAAFAKAGEHFDNFAKGIHEGEAAKAFSDIRESADANAKAIAAQSASMNGGTFAAENMAEAMKEVAANAKKIDDTLLGLEKQVDQAGMTPIQKKLDDLKDLNATPEQLQQAEGLLKTIAKQKVVDKLADKAKEVEESIRTPIDIYNDKLSELTRLLEHNLIDQDAFDRASTIAQQTMDDAFAGHHAQALEAGSAEAQRFVYEQSRGVNTLSKDEVPRKQLAEQETMSEFLRRIERNTRQGTTDDTELLDSF